MGETAGVVCRGSEVLIFGRPLLLLLPATLRTHRVLQAGVLGAAVQPTPAQCCCSQRRSELGQLRASTNPRLPRVPSESKPGGPARTWQPCAMLHKPDNPSFANAISFFLLMYSTVFSSGHSRPCLSPAKPSRALRSAVKIAPAGLCFVFHCFQNRAQTVFLVARLGRWLAPPPSRRHRRL